MCELFQAIINGNGAQTTLSEALGNPKGAFDLNVLSGLSITFCIYISYGVDGTVQFH